MSSLKLTLRSWPVIAAATIGLCYLTQTVAGWLGINLPDQKNIEIVRQYGLHAFDSLRHFGVFAFLCLQVLVLLPAVEEVVFRGLLWRLPVKMLCKGEDARQETEDGGGRQTRDMRRAKATAAAVVSSALFSAAHYLAQPWPDAAFIALFFFGLAQCWLYQKTSRLWCAILNHGLFNLTNLVLLFLLPEA